MVQSRSQTIFNYVSKTILLAAGLTVLLWLLQQIASVLLFTLFAIVLAIVLNAPVTWLEQRHVHRGIASILVFACIAGLFGLLGWLVLPRLIDETTGLFASIPAYATKLQDWFDSFLHPYPRLREILPGKSKITRGVMPTLPGLINRATSISFSFFTFIASILILLAIVIYMVLRPRPLLQLYLNLFPLEQRNRAARAFSASSVMLVGWIWSNIVVGAIEAVIVGVALWLLHVPAALVWASLALFSELIPKLGIYIMAIPPILVSLAVDPPKALWVALFYIALNEITGDFVTPRIRAKAMDLHPVSILFIMMVMAVAFGLFGALIATPITAFIKAYFEEFYPPARTPVQEGDHLVEQMIRRELPSP